MEERRKGMEEITGNIAQIKNYLENQFGGIDLAGNKVEGRVTEQLRLLNEKVHIQNGRVTKLEIKNARLAGALALFTIGTPIILFLINRAVR